MSNLAERSQQAEIMDDLGIPFDEFNETYQQLEKINHLTFTYYPTLRAIKKLWKKHKRKKQTNPQTHLNILDIGCGNGDMLREIYRFTQRKKIPVILTGIDINEHAIQSAKQATPEFFGIFYKVGDVFKLQFQNEHDIIITSMVMHHLPQDVIVRMMRWMTKQARIGWFINDLHRHPVAYHFIKHLVKLLGMNRMIQNDAPLSVARAFRRSDWEKIIQESYINASRARIQWYWNFRYGVYYDAT